MLVLRTSNFRGATIRPIETDNVQGQISKHIFTPNGGYRVNYPSNIVRNTHSFENWGISSPVLHGEYLVTQCV